MDRQELSTQHPSTMPVASGCACNLNHLEAVLHVESSILNQTFFRYGTLMFIIHYRFFDCFFDTARLLAPYHDLLLKRAQPFASTPPLSITSSIILPVNHLHVVLSRNAQCVSSVAQQSLST